ncbi:MAG: helix-turn-helix transcriptional regulator [Leptolyngbyaceae cyanobacterium CSU_1_3]|nr:helix-turn-helix transcriptional regulator [Leptolyngbyaceae cyanobacterium CSU_1_3]
MTDEEVKSPLVELRKRAGVTQKAVADALGVTDHTVRNWEKGREEPRLFIWQVKALCNLLHCELEELPDHFKSANKSAEA